MPVGMALYMQCPCLMLGDYKCMIILRQKMAFMRTSIIKAQIVNLRASLHAAQRHHHAASRISRVTRVTAC